MELFRCKLCRYLTAPRQFGNKVGFNKRFVKEITDTKQKKIYLSTLPYSHALTDEQNEYMYTKYSY